MVKEITQKLALIYVEKNLAAGDPPLRALELFEEAQGAIEKACNERTSKHISSPDWGL